MSRRVLETVGKADAWRKAYRENKRDPKRCSCGATLSTPNRERGTCELCESRKDKAHIADPEATWSGGENIFEASRRERFGSRQEGQGKRPGYVAVPGLDASRQRLGMSYKKFALYLGFPETNVVRWCAGRSEAPIEVVELITGFLDTTVEELTRP